jgi:hypothetical protein
LQGDLLERFSSQHIHGTFTGSGAGEYCDVDRALVIEVDSFNPPVAFIPHILETFPFHEISSYFGANRSML